MFRAEALTVLISFSIVSFVNEQKISVMNVAITILFSSSYR
jgi:hypothetical protein